MLLKALYGLHQAGRVRNKKFDYVLVVVLHFIRSAADLCVYFKCVGNSPLILAIHVDDTVMFGKCVALSTFKTDLATRFQLTDLSKLKSFLGLQLKHKRATKTTWIHQTWYIHTIFERFGMQNSHLVAMPLDHGVRLIPLSADEQHLTAQVSYAIAIGSLMWAAISTHPDLAFAVQTLSQFIICKKLMLSQSAKSVHFRRCPNGWTLFRCSKH